MARELKRVVFRTKYGAYNAGDSASFGVVAADDLIAKRYALPFGDRAVLKKHGFSVAEDGTVTQTDVDASSSTSDESKPKARRGGKKDK